MLFVKTKTNLKLTAHADDAKKNILKLAYDHVPTRTQFWAVAINAFIISLLFVNYVFLFGTQYRLSAR